MAKKKKMSEELTRKFEDAELVSKIASQFNKSDSFFYRYITDTDRWYGLWRNISTKPDNQFRSRVTVPVGFWTIETTVPRMVSQPHHFTMTPRDSDNPDIVTHSIQAKQYFEYVLDQALMKRKTRQIAKDMKIFGSGFWKYNWDARKGEASISVLPLRKLRIDPNVTEPANIQACRYIIDTTKLTKDEIMENPLYNKNVTEGMFEKLEGGGDSTGRSKGGDSNDTTDRSRNTRLASRGLLNNTADPTENEYDIWECFTWIDGKRHIVVILDKQWVIRNDEWDYDFWPFSMTVNTEDPDNILGVGDIEPVATLIEDINTNRRLRTDNKNIRTNVMFERVRNAGIRDEDLKWTPGGVIDSNIQNGITPIAIPDTTGGSLEEELLNYQVVEKATNTPAQIQGQLRASGGEAGGLLNRTATAFKGAQQETNIRFKYQSESLDRCVQETLRNLWKMISDTVTQDQVARVIGADDSTSFQDIPKEAIKAEYLIDIKFGSAALEDEQTKREEALVKLQTLSNIFPASTELFIKDFLIAMGDKNVDEVAGIIAAQKKAAEQQENLPKPPQINVSVGGEDINPIMTQEMLANYFTFSKTATTPELNPETRRLMFGQTLEKNEQEKLELEKDRVKIELFKAISDAEANDKKLNNEQVKIIADISKEENGQRTDGQSEGNDDDSRVETVDES